MGYELSAERWSPVQSVEKILLSVVSMLAGKPHPTKFLAMKITNVALYLQNQMMNLVQMLMQQSCGVINVNNLTKLRKVLYVKHWACHHKNQILLT